MATSELKTTACACERCGHRWAARAADKLPKSCPKCHSPYWDRARKNAPSPNQVMPKADA